MKNYKRGATNQAIVVVVAKHKVANLAIPVYLVPYTHTVKGIGLNYKVTKGLTNNLVV